MLLILLFFYFFTLGYQWLQLSLCKSLTESFYFNKDIYLFHLQHFFHTDQELPHLITRAFHNKLSIFFPDVLNAYLQYWDLLFIVSFLGLISTVSFLYAFWKAFTKPNKLSTTLLILVILLPLVMVLAHWFIPSVIGVLPLWIVWQGFSLYGLLHLSLIKSKKVRIFLLIACLVTVVWFAVFDQQIYSYCLKG